jgi:MFS family permease
MVGIIMGTYEVSLAFGLLLCGKLLNNNVSKPLLMMVGFGLLSCSLLAFAFSFSTPSFIVCRAVMGFSSALVTLPAQGLTVTAVPNLSDSTYSDVPYTTRVGGGVGFVAGPLLGGLVFTLTDFRTTFLVAAVIVACQGPIMLHVTSRFTHVRRNAVSSRDSAALSVLCSSSRALGVLLAEGVAALVEGMMQAMLPIHMANTFGIGASKVSMIVAIASLSAAATSDLVEQYMRSITERGTAIPWTALASGLLGISTLALAAPVPIKWLIPLVILWGGARACVHEAAAAECLWGLLAVCTTTDVAATDRRLAGRHIPGFTASRAAGLARAVGASGQVCAQPAQPIIAVPGASGAWLTRAARVPQLGAGALVDWLGMASAALFLGQALAALSVFAVRCPARGSGRKSIGYRFVRRVRC